MPRLMEIRKQHGFPQPFGKASQKTLGFTTFSTASTAGSHSTRFRPSLYADNSVLNFWEKSPVGRAHSILRLECQKGYKVGDVEFLPLRDTRGNLPGALSGVKDPLLKILSGYLGRDGEPLNNCVSPPLEITDGI